MFFFRQICIPKISVCGPWSSHTVHGPPRIRTTLEPWNSHTIRGPPKTRTTHWPSSCHNCHRPPRTRQPVGPWEVTLSMDHQSLAQPMGLWIVTLSMDHQEKAQSVGSGIVTLSVDHQAQPVCPLISHTVNGPPRECTAIRLPKVKLFLDIFVCSFNQSTNRLLTYRKPIYRKSYGAPNNK